MKIKRKWRYIPFNISNGYKNMAIDEFLLDEVIDNDSPNVLRFYKWNPSTATIGFHQSLSSEINLSNAEKYNIDIVRRISGGGAVLHDFEGEITYSIICKLKDIPKINTNKRFYDPKIPQRYHAILESLAQGLGRIGVKIDSKQIHCPALLSRGKKISGNAQKIKNSVLLQHGTILLTVKPDFMYKILKTPEGVSSKRMVKSVRSKVTGILQNSNLALKLSSSSDYEKIIVESLKNGFMEIFNIELEKKPLLKTELKRILKLSKNKYKNIDWLKKYP